MRNQTSQHTLVAQLKRCVCAQLGGVIYLAFLILIAVIMLACLPAVNFIFVFLYDLCRAATVITDGSITEAAGANTVAGKLQAKVLEKSIEARQKDPLRKAYRSAKSGVGRLKNIRLRGITGEAVSYDNTSDYTADDEYNNPHMSAQEMSVHMRRRAARHIEDPARQGAVTRGITEMRDTLTSWLTAINVLSAQGGHTRVDDSDTDKEDRVV